jgi:hypothetical protein
MGRMVGKGSFGGLKDTWTTGAVFMRVWMVE